MAGALVQRVVDALPKRWEKLGDIVLLPSAVGRTVQGSRFNVHTLASGQTRGFVLNTSPGPKQVFIHLAHLPTKGCSNSVPTQCSHSETV